MNYAKIRNYDIANGEGVRISLFVSGCTNHCFNCFNPEEQDFTYGEKYNRNVESYIRKLLNNKVISGLSLLGGDPLCQDIYGIRQLIELCDYTHDIHKNVWLWTGFIWEDILHNKTNSYLDSQKLELLYSCDIVIDGLFINELSNMALKWRGSENQRIIDVQKSIKSNHVVLYQEREI